MSLLLGLKYTDGRDSINPTASQFVNDLPGFSVRALANATSSDHITAGDTFNKIAGLTYKSVYSDFYSMLGRYINLNTIYDIEKRKVSGSPISGEGYLTFDKACLDPFVKFKIKTLVVKFNIETSIIVTITDGVDTIDIPFDVVPGFNNLEINYTFNSNNGRVSFTSEGWETGSECCDLGYFNCYSSCGNYDLEGNIGYVAMCVVDKIAIADMFSDDLNLAALWKFGILSCEEYLNSDRVNWLVDMKKDQAATNIAYWGQPYNPTTKEVGVYWRTIFNAVQNAKMQIKLGDYVSPVGSTIVNFTP